MKRWLSLIVGAGLLAGLVAAPLLLHSALPGTWIRRPLCPSRCQALGDLSHPLEGVTQPRVLLVGLAKLFGASRARRGPRPEGGGPSSVHPRATQAEHADSASGLAGADASLEAADPLSEHVQLLHRTPRCVLRLACPTGALVERPSFLVDRACVRRVVDREPRAASLDPTDTAGRIGWAWAWQRPGQHPQDAPVPRCRSHDSPAPKLVLDLHVPQGAKR